MASNTMNFGPEWMRRFPARTTQSQPDLLASAPSPPPVTPTHQDWGQSTLSSSQGTTPAFSYSSIAASNVRSHGGAQSSDTSVSESANGGTSNGISSPFASDSLNPFKYSKELMLALYKPTGLPIEFERHDIMTSEEPIVPMSTLPFSEHEVKLLSGSVNSEVARRTTQPGDSLLERPQGQRRESLSTSGDNSGRYDRSEKNSYSRAYDSRGYSNGARPRTLNTESRSFSFKRTEQVVAEERVTEPEEDGLWNSPVGNTVGSFDANGVFRISGEGEELQPLTELENTSTALLDGEATNTLPVEDEDHVGTKLTTLQPPDQKYSDHESDKSDNVSPTPSQHAVESSAPVDNNRIPITMLTGKPTDVFATQESDDPDSLSDKQALDLAPEPNIKSVPVEMSRWLYRDPSGSIQGPFLSDEMHEWYKGGFFTMDLLVKREQDSTFEPLGSLIRKVGSDDQPFLMAGSIQSELPQPPIHLNHLSMSSLTQSRQPIAQQLPQSSNWMGMSAPSTPNTTTFGGDRLMQQQQQRIQQQHSSGDLFSSTNGLGQQRPGFEGARDSPSLTSSESRWNSGRFNCPQLAEPNIGWGGDAFSRSPVANMAAAHTPLGNTQYMEQQQRLRNQEMERLQYMQLLQRQAQMQSVMHQQQFMVARQQFGADPQALAALLAQQQAQQRQLQMRYQQLQLTGFHAQGPSTPGGTAVPWGGMGQPSSPWTTSVISSNAENYFDHNKGEGNQLPHSMRQQLGPLQPHNLHLQQHQPFQPLHQEPTQYNIGGPNESAMQFDQAHHLTTQESQPSHYEHQHQNRGLQSPQREHSHTIDDINDGMTDLQVTEKVILTDTKDVAKSTEQISEVEETVKSTRDTENFLDQAEACEKTQEAEKERLEEWVKVEGPISDHVTQFEFDEDTQMEKSPHDNKLDEGSLAHQDKNENVESEIPEIIDGMISEAVSNATIPPNIALKASPAPWAKLAHVDDEAAEKKGPKLREIQELEAKKSQAAKAEKQAQLAAATVHSGNATFDFVKGMPGAPAWSSNAPTTPKKKTLKEIQEEEEATMKKARAATTQHAHAVGLTPIITSNTGSTGKRYADAIGPKTPVANSGPWGLSPITTSRPTLVTRNTVVSSNPSNQSPTTPHSRGSENSWIEVGAKRDSDPTPPVSRNTGTTPVNKNANPNEPRPASEDFLRWCRQALKGLQGVVLEDFIQMLLTFPLNPDPMTVEIIQDSIYANSQSLNGRQFADEFIKRRKADAFPNGTPALMNSGYIAATTPDSSFKVVSKKGKKKGHM
ncbi:hypothetical protein FBU30_002596 [Linnemannia zychae]|nr:hypothetical protein FBU30_002596 [Linnemannia zychae]